MTKETTEQTEMGREELKTLTIMAERWQKADLALADCDGTEDFIYTDYLEKIAQWMMPYTERLREIKAVTDEEYGEFCKVIFLLSDELREKLCLPASNTA